MVKGGKVACVSIGISSQMGSPFIIFFILHVLPGDWKTYVTFPP